jgi:hypothetical protein
VATFYCTAAIVWMVCVRILVGSVLSFVYSSTGSHYTKQQSASHNFEPFAFRLHILSIILEIRVFLSSLMWWRNECVPRDSCKTRVFATTTIMTTTRPLKPIEHHHQTRIHATIVISQACLINSTVSKQHFSLLFTTFLYVSFFFLEMPHDTHPIYLLVIQASNRKRAK